jgi:hypothetical protein
MVHCPPPKMIHIFRRSTDPCVTSTLQVPAAAILLRLWETENEKTWAAPKDITSIPSLVKIGHLFYFFKKGEWNKTRFLSTSIYL